MIKFLSLVFFCALIVMGLCLSLSPAMANDLENALIKQGDVYGDVRYRYESVEQDGPTPVTENATASTLRTRLGYKTGLYENFRALIETDFIGHMGDENYNDGKNGKTSHPLIADPATVELNQLWLSWAGIPDTTIKLGRQVLNLDNQRFIGSVGWRQNDQTFDAIYIENKSTDNLDLSYGYIRTVNRVFGHDHPQGDWSGNVHIGHAAYLVAPWLTVTGYGYWLDFNLAPASSNKTYGLRLTGDVPLSDAWTLFYEAEGARQSEDGNNPASYNETYYALSPGFKNKNGLTLQAGYEVLGGDGADAFQTPLATLHAFNGWADKFLTTPANGLEDAYARISYKVSGAGKWINNTTFDAIYHDFDAEDTNLDYGTEWDIQISRTFNTAKETYPFKEWSVSLKYADYEARDLYTDTQKIWLSVGTKF